MKSNTTNLLQNISWEDLTSADRMTTVPFSLALTDSTDLLTIEEIIRIIPSKRLVAYATWGDRHVVAKLFYDSKAKKHALRDFEGTEALQAAGVPTPACYYIGSDTTKKIHVLIFERLVDAENLATLWNLKTDLESIEPLLHAVTLELATQHVMGILQRDLHFKNFMVNENQIHTLDGGNIERHNKPIAKAESLENLALFFSQLGIGAEKLKQKLFHTYIQSRGWLVKSNDYHLLQAEVAQWNKKRWQQYEKKIMRDCTAFCELKAASSRIVYDRNYHSAKLVEFLKHPDEAFTKPDTIILKAGRSSTVAKIMLNGKPLVVKRYNIKNIWHRIRRLFRTTRALHSWRLAHYLQFFGISTAKPIAFIENNFFGMRGKSYFVMEYIDGTHLGNYFSKSIEDTSYVLLATRVVRIFENLTRLSLTHGDLKMTNIMVVNEKPILLDLDGMKKHASQLGLKLAYNKEIKRFLANWDNSPSVKKLFERLLQK